MPSVVSLRLWPSCPWICPWWWFHLTSSPSLSPPHPHPETAEGFHTAPSLSLACLHRPGGYSMDVWIPERRQTTQIFATRQPQQVSYLKNLWKRKTNLDWHSCAVQPKWEEAFLSFQRLVTNSKLQETSSTGETQSSVYCCGISASKVSVICAE